MKVKDRTILFILSLIIFSLSGCVTTPIIKMDQIKTIQKKMTPSQVHQLLQEETQKVVEINFENKKFLAEYVEMVTGTNVSLSFLCDKFGCQGYPVPEYNTAAYVFLYKMEKNNYQLLEWGFVSDLNKSESNTVRSVMKKAEIKVQQ